MDRLETMPSTLILRGCSINTKGIEPIAKRLAVDKQLQKLDLAENRLGPADIQSLADALRHNETLRSLNLAGNELGTGAVQALINLVHNAKSLRHLDVSAAVLTAEDKVALQQANAFRQGEPLDLVM
jgi:Ran GTPase-activating protein (RanGAP) involved in mRNA processing and transport